MAAWKAKRYVWKIKRYKLTAVLLIVVIVFGMIGQYASSVLADDGAELEDSTGPPEEGEEGLNGEDGEGDEDDGEEGDPEGEEEEDEEGDPEGGEEICEVCGEDPCICEDEDGDDTPNDEDEPEETMKSVQGTMGEDDEEEEELSFIVFPGWNASASAPNRSMGISPMSSPLPTFGSGAGQSAFTKTITPDTSNFRQYDVKLEFTPESASMIEVTNESVKMTSMHIPENQDDFLTHIKTVNIWWIEKGWTTVRDAQNYMNALGANLNTSGIGDNGDVFVFNTGNSNAVVGAAANIIPCYFKWRAFELDSGGVPTGVIVDDILVYCEYNAVSGTLIPPGTSTPNVFSPVVANIANIGKVVTQNGVDYMLINMAGFINNANNAPNGSMVLDYVASMTTTTYDRVTISAIHDAVPEGFEIISASVTWTNSNTSGSIGISTDKKNLVVDTPVIFKPGACSISYKIQPIDAGTTSDYWSNGIIDLHGGDTYFTMQATHSSNDNSFNGSAATNSPATTHNFDVPPLFKIDLTINAGSDELNSDNPSTDHYHSRIIINNKSTLAAEIELLNGFKLTGTNSVVNDIFEVWTGSNTTTTKYAIPQSWINSYIALLNGSTTTFTQEDPSTPLPIAPTGTTAIVTGNTIGDYYFTATAYLDQSTYAERTSTNTKDYKTNGDGWVWLEVIGGRLIIRTYWVETASQGAPHNQDSLHFADVRVSEKAQSNSFHVASEIAPASRRGINDTVYEAVPYADNYEATVYLPYGYVADSTNDKFTARSAKGYYSNGIAYEDYDYIIIIPITTAKQPFYRDCSDGGGQ